MSVNRRQCSGIANVLESRIAQGVELVFGDREIIGDFLRRARCAVGVAGREGHGLLFEQSGLVDHLDELDRGAALTFKLLAELDRILREL